MDPDQFLKCISLFSLDRIILYWSKLYDLRNLIGLPVWFSGPITNHRLTSNLMDITNHVDLVLGFLWRHSTLVCRNHKDWLYSWHFYHLHTWQACKGLGCISTALVHSLDKLRNKEKIYRQRLSLEEAGNSFPHVANCYIWNDEINASTV